MPHMRLRPHAMPHMRLCLCLNVFPYLPLPLPPVFVLFLSPRAYNFLTRSLAGARALFVSLSRSRRQGSGRSKRARQEAGYRDACALLLSVAVSSMLLLALSCASSCSVLFATHCVMRDTLVASYCVMLVRQDILQHKTCCNTCGNIPSFFLLLLHAQCT
jgi:hypothetical protein